MTIVLLLSIAGCADKEAPTESAAPAEPTALSLQPWLQITGDGARLRFETLEDVEIAVALDGASVPVERASVDLEYGWPNVDDPEEYEDPDMPGTHVLHTATLTGLTAGQSHAWSVDLGDQSVQGAFTASPDAGGAFRIGFVSDTMAPYQSDIISKLAEHSPDLTLHGGDIQYQSNPIDTWSGAMNALSAIGAPMHLAVGNHEVEGYDEYTHWYTRLLQGHGDSPADGVDYHAFTYGGVRFISLDSEGVTSPLSDPDGDQIAWLTAELQAAAADPAILYPVVFYHHPTYTLGNHAPKTDIRANTHPLFVEHGVPLVLTGHNHSYERFLADGVTYLVDGGGGALLYDVDDNVENYPDEVDLRQASSQTRGFTILDVQADGSIAGQRFDEDGAQVDSFTVSAP